MDSNEKVLQKPKTENLYFISGQADFLKLYELKKSKCWKKKLKKKTKKKGVIYTSASQKISLFSAQLFRIHIRIKVEEMLKWFIIVCFLNSLTKT